MPPPPEIGLTNLCPVSLHVDFSVLVVLNFMTRISLLKMTINFDRRTMLATYVTNVVSNFRNGAPSYFYNSL